MMKPSPESSPTPANTTIKMAVVSPSVSLLADSGQQLQDLIMMREHTGSDWDATKNTIIADDDWWEKKIKLNEEFGY
ncbi:hypothetical protein P3S67_022921 [Capsicum chacoense]